MAIDYNTRSRNWFLCVNEGAECYPSVSSICESLTNCTYGYIQHEPEIVEGDDGLSKGWHYHIVLAFENARTFTSVTKAFRGAHVETAHVLSNCTAYLLHATASAIKAGKKQYDSSLIQSNNIDAIRSWLGDKGLQFESFSDNRILEYILFDNCRSISAFYMRFGSVIQRYIPLINALLNETSVSGNYDKIDEYKRLFRSDDENGYNVYSVN